MDITGRGLSHMIMTEMRRALQRGEGLVPEDGGGIGSAVSQPQERGGKRKSGVTRVRMTGIVWDFPTPGDVYLSDMTSLC